MNLEINEITHIHIRDNSLFPYITNEPLVKVIEFESETTLYGYKKLMKLLRKPFKDRKEKINLKYKGNKYCQLIDIEKLSYSPLTRVINATATIGEITT
jgi:hypothetical protein